LEKLDPLFESRFITTDPADLKALRGLHIGKSKMQGKPLIGSMEKKLRVRKLIFDGPEDTSFKETNYRIE
jgi:hypothetical protein